MKSVCIRLKEGDKVIECDDKAQARNPRVGVIKQIVLTPNGHNSPGLVAVLHVKFKDGGCVSTSDKFRPLDDVEYEEFYPSVMLVKD